MTHRADAHWFRRFVLAAVTAFAAVVVVKAWTHPPAACWTDPQVAPDLEADALDG